MSVHLALGVVVSALVAAPGCSGGSKPQADAGPPSLQIGTGSSMFEPLQDGDNIFIVQGPQGGYHFFGSLRARNINPGNAEDLSDPANPTTTFEAYVNGARVDAMASTYRQGLEIRGGVAEMIGRTVILDILDDSELDGAMVRFVVSIEDADGVMLSDERDLVAVADPANQ